LKPLFLVKKKKKNTTEHENMFVILFA